MCSRRNTASGIRGASWLQVTDSQYVPEYMWPPYCKAQNHSLPLHSSQLLALSQPKRLCKYSRPSHSPSTATLCNKGTRALPNLNTKTVANNDSSGTCLVWGSRPLSSPLASPSLSSTHPLRWFFSLSILCSSHKGKCCSTQGRLS